MCYCEDDTPHAIPDYLKKMTREELQDHIKKLLAKYDKPLKDKLPRIANA
jgi:predicted metal-dependent hydrolase